MTNEFTFLMLPPQTDLTRQWARRLSESVPGMKLVLAEDPKPPLRRSSTADAAFGTLPAELLAKARRLRWLQAPQAAPPAGYYYSELVIASTDRHQFPRNLQRPYQCPYPGLRPGLCSRAACLYPATTTPRVEEAAEDKGVVPLPGATALIVGLGGIGAETARLLSAFGVRVLAVDARRTEKPDQVAELHPPEALDHMLPQADFVILTVPHTPATEGFFNTTKFRLMKRSAFFINIGRGMTTKLDDLVAALRDGEIAGAALDVYEQEPLPAEHPLWGMPNVLLTPHMAGYGPHLNERRFQIIQDNCRAFANGEPLRTSSTRQTGFSPVAD